MPEHQGLPVEGYQPQTEESVRLVNANKLLEEQVLRTIDALREQRRHDDRWLAIARTDIEKGFMALNRAIFQPKRIG